LERSIEIDLSKRGIDSIDINTFKGYNKLEKLFLENNKLRKLVNFVVILLNVGTV
jgi:hypothetical protein